MEIVFDKYKKVADFCYELFRISELPLYFSKFSNRIYSNYQKLFLLVYKQFRKFTYEDLLTDLGSNQPLREYLGLQYLPHYTTLIKFAAQLPAKVLGKLVIAFAQLMPHTNKIAIDATGLSLDNASSHYCKRLGIPYKKRPFMKTTFAVDIETFCILLCRMRKKPRHDTKDAKPMIVELAKHYSPDLFYADRGYDDNNLFKLVVERLKAFPLIFQRRQDVPKHRRKGEYRKWAFGIFDYGEYLQRNRGETSNSIYKKRFGSSVKSRRLKMQRVEILLRVVAYNIDRLIRLGTEIILEFVKILRVSY